MWVKASDLLSVRAWELRFCGRDAPWLEETTRSAAWKRWLWHSLVAVGEVLSVSHRESSLQINLPNPVFYCLFRYSEVLSLNKCAGFFTAIVPDMAFE